ncbi:hypothetical protein ACWED2_04805 [Amycolatopsis sp. NPDC005003]
MIVLDACGQAVLSFDVTGSASLYSQMAGVLAAFAFAAVTLVLPGMHRRASVVSKREEAADVRSDSLVLLALISAFVSLLIATLQYSVLAGERGCALIKGRAASEEFLGGVAFAFAVLLLLYAIVQLVGNSGIAGLSFHARLIVTVLGAPLAILFLTTGAFDVAATPWAASSVTGELGPNLTPFRNFLANVSLPLSAGLFALCLIAWLVGFRFRGREPRLSLGRSKSHLLKTLFPYLSLVLSVAAVTRSVGLDIVRPDDRIHDWEVAAWLSICCAVLLLQAVLLAFDHGSEYKAEIGAEAAQTDPIASGENSNHI